MKFIHRLPILVILFCITLVSQAAESPKETIPLTIRYTIQQTVDGENSIGVTFSHPLDGSQNLAPYFFFFTDEGEPVAGGWILSKDQYTAYFTHVDPRTPYEIKVKKGIKSQAGGELDQDHTFSVTTRSANPMIRFGSKGFILASRLTRGLPVTAMNVNRADVDFFRIKPEKLGEFRELVAHEDQIYYYESEDLNRIADLVYSGRWELENKPDIRTQANLPIKRIKALKTPGIYLAVLRGAGLYGYNYSRTWFTISDLGLSLRKYDQSLSFFVQSLETARPVSQVTLQGHDAKGRRLFQLKTNEQGQADLQGQFPKLKTLVALKDNQVSLLPVDLPALDLSEFKTAVAPFRRTEFYVFGPRDIYRPGETVTTQGLLRDQDGSPTKEFPIQTKVFQPDGRMVHEFIWKGDGRGFFRNRHTLPGDAMTGKWRMAFSQAGTPLGEYPFLVSDFMPERLAFDLDNPPGQGEILAPEDTLVLDLEGRFLYGAPASDIPADALIRIKPARELFNDTHPGYEFGTPDNTLDFSYATDQIRLDKAGKGQITVENQWKADIHSPHWVTANASLHDTSGRAVVRKKSWQIWPAPSLVGIRPLARDGEMEANTLAEFDVIKVDREGKSLAAMALEVKIIREHREYFWEFKNGSWEWGATHHFYPVDEWTLELDGQRPGRVRFPVENGGYRLEIRDPATGQVSRSDIWAGWRPDQGQALNRPDRVDMGLDKRSYGAGETARVTLKSPEGGRGYIFVEGNLPLYMAPVTLPPEGATVEIPVKPEWNRHDLHISAFIVRPGDPRAAHLPKRSVGRVHLPLDRESRRLELDIQLPPKLEGGRRIGVPVKVTLPRGLPRENVQVVLAAVDEGVLNLTRFKTPSAFDYFFQPRSPGVELQDVFQKLIESNDGPQARHRFGGDAPGLTRGGDKPATDVRIVSLSPAPQGLDQDGLAHFELDIPEFNGQLRLMALAFSPDQFGSADQDLTLASPLVTQMALPRFLAWGDESRLVLDLHNLSGLDQMLNLELKFKGPISPTGPSTLEIPLARDEKQSLIIPVKAAHATGRSQIEIHITGLEVNQEKREIQRSWFLDTRPSHPPQTIAFHKTLDPGEKFTLPKQAWEKLVPTSRLARLSLGSIPPLNTADHIRELRAYPYGCLEQTISGLFPFVILSNADMEKLGIAPDPKAPEKIRLGIQRLLEKQKAGGGFGLWDSQGREEPWLTAYAAHFFLLARQAGYEIPEAALKRTLKRLLTYVRRPRNIPVGWGDATLTRANVRAYAAFVLAHTRNLTLGDARSTARAATPHLKSSLGHIHMGLALLLTGDTSAAQKALNRAAITRRGDKLPHMGDYGSDVRDFAMAYALLDYAPDFNKRNLFLHELNRELKDRDYLSTQERNGLVMAGTARLRAIQSPWQARLTTAAGNRPLGHDTPSPGELRGHDLDQGLTLTNGGQSPLYVNLSLAGIPSEPSPPITTGAKIQRQYLDLNGTPIKDLGQLAPGDRILTALTIDPQVNMPHALVVDLLPAGLELSDPALANSPAIDDIKIHGKTIRQWHHPGGHSGLGHAEYRDDRFVAAIPLFKGRTSHLFYAAQLIHPGQFKVPPPLVEDMYLPELRGQGRTGAPWVIPAP